MTQWHRQPVKLETDGGQPKKPKQQPKNLKLCQLLGLEVDAVLQFGPIPEECGSASELVAKFEAMSLQQFKARTKNFKAPISQLVAAILLSLVSIPPAGTLTGWLIELCTV